MYNNLMYAAAGKAIEALRGNTLLYEDILLEELLQPLNMSSTVFYHRAGPTYEGFVTPYIPDMPNNPYELIENPKDAWR